jgi:hypothetical protein
VAACTSNANCQAAAPVCSASLGKCVPSPCQICQGCVSSAHDYVASQARAQDSAAVALAFYTWCTSNPALELTACAKTMAAVAASPRGNLGERAHEPSVQLCLCLVCLPILVRHFWRIASQCYCTPLQASEPVPCACGLANARRPLLAMLAARWTPPASAAAQPLSGASLTSAAWRGLQWGRLRLCPASPSVALWQQGAAFPLRTAAVLTSCEWDRAPCTAPCCPSHMHLLTVSYVQWVYPPGARLQVQHGCVGEYLHLLSRQRHLHVRRLVHRNSLQGKGGG